MTVHDRPRADELATAVREFLEQDVLPALDGRLAFHTRVALNALGMLERELTQGPEEERALRARLSGLLDHDGSTRDLLADLAGRIRSGALNAADRAVVAAVRDSVRVKLAIANPGYLASGSAGD